MKINVNYVVVDDEIAVIERLREEIAFCANRAVVRQHKFRCGVSGGSLVQYLSKALNDIACDLSKWKLYFCDERYVDEDDAESTYGAYKKELIQKGLLKAEQFVRIDNSLPLEACAKDYEMIIREEFQCAPEDCEIPAFDLLLLGMGPDGHTCSLFPGHKLLEERKLLIAPLEDSPKPPPKRVTMTFPLINNAKCCIFAMCGAGKADMAKRVFFDKEPLPASLVAPKSGRLICIFDKEAGKHYSP